MLQTTSVTNTTGTSNLDPIGRKIYFYQVDVGIDESGDRSQFNAAEILDFVATLNCANGIGSRYRDEGNGNVIALFDAPPSNFGISMALGRTQRTALPQVEHAQTLAAILSADGISARAVSGSTDRYTRRRIVEDFRAGKLKVLVNYGVFREGFDAPKTRAIIVARPVYSPNLYFQMIGRGLRGVKNGGNDRCLILDVNDNIVNFDRNLAFTELDWLWD